MPQLVKKVRSDFFDKLGAARMQPQRIVYVSCDPATLARDVKLFAQEGYGAVRAAAVDMFPGTANIESVVRLERTK